MCARENQNNKSKSYKKKETLSGFNLFKMFFNFIFIRTKRNLGDNSCTLFISFENSYQDDN